MPDDPNAKPAEMYALAGGERGAAHRDVSGAVPEESAKRYRALFENELTDLIAHSATDGKAVDPGLLSRLVVMSRKLDDAEATAPMYHQAYLAALLVRSPSQKQPADGVIDDLEFVTSRNSPAWTVLKGLTSSCIAIIMFLMIVLLAIAFIKTGERDGLGAKFMHYAGSSMSVAVFFGITGSAVSALLRLSDFEKNGRRSRRFLWVTGAVLPWVGAAFAAVTYALFASGIINFKPEGQDLSQFYIVIGFLAGFSERFTRGLLGAAENAVAGAAERKSDGGDKGGKKANGENGSTGVGRDGKKPAVGKDQAVTGRKGKGLGDK